MKSKHKNIFRLFLVTVIMIINFGSMPGIVIAAPEDGVIDITVEYGIEDCGVVTFNISLDDITPPYQLDIDYGAGDAAESWNFEVLDVIPLLTNEYFDRGDYDLTITVTETGDGGLTGTFSDVVTIGPTVDLSSDPFPPLVGPGDTVVFTASVDPEELPGEPPYVYTWDLNGDGSPEPEIIDTASFTYTGTEKYQAQVSVEDSCGFVDTATLPVVVSDPGDICHPTAQKISDGVNSLFPNQTGDLYTCEEIYDIFDGLTDDSQVGFGRMWKAYNLALTMEELTWEDILAWHLDVGGWGALLQLDRFSELLETHSLGDLMARVMSEEFSLGDVRTAVRSVTRFEADFEDALTRIAEGATAGELGQLYKLAADLEVDPAALDVYLVDGFTLSELKHTANFADRMDVDWTEIATARAYADSWGELKKAYQMATDEVSAAEILIDGVHEPRKDLQEANQEAKVEQQSAQKEEKNQQTGKKLAEQYPAEFGDVMILFEEGECKGDWACVRKALREQESTQTEGLSEKGSQVALQIALKYGVSDVEVTEHFNLCGGDWACTRAYFRELSANTKETGKPKKK